MPLADEIEVAMKEFAKAIIAAEAEKKEIMKHGAGIQQVAKNLKDGFKTVIADLVDAQRMLEDATTGYKAWIDSQKAMMNQFAEYKKKSVEAEKFYQTLLQEKKEREAAAKKSGSTTLSREDQLFEAVFNRAKRAYENDPTPGVELTLKETKEISATYAEQQKRAVDQLKRAAAAYHEMAMSMKNIKRKKLSFVHFQPAKPVDQLFGDYFKKVKKEGKMAF